MISETLAGLEIEKNMTCQTKSFSQFKYDLASIILFFFKLVIVSYKLW